MMTTFFFKAERKQEFPEKLNGVLRTFAEFKWLKGYKVFEMLSSANEI